MHMQKQVTETRTSKSPTRSYPREVTERLYALSAGWCEFRGCRTFTLRHEPTQQDGVFGQRAHIYAFSDRGPRPVPDGVVVDVNGLENLMLLCPPCHKLIDDNEDQYTVDLLREFKRDHEDRIHLLAGLGPERMSKPLVFLANIAKDPVAVADSDVFTAMFPDMFPASKVNGLDFSAFPDRTDWYGNAGTEAMEVHLGSFYKEPPNGARPAHVSVFAFGPMPLLMLLGASMTNKVATRFFQRHRPDGRWKWGSGEGTAEYTVTSPKWGSVPGQVALVLSLSGKIHHHEAGIPEDFTVYEIEVKDGEAGPNPQFLKTEADLDRFRKAYLETISRIVQEHPGIKEIRVYPAVPIPVALACGYDLLPKAHPDLVVYDMDKAKGGFRETIKISRKDV